MSTKLIMSSILYVILLLIVLPTLATAQTLNQPQVFNAEYYDVCKVPVGENVIEYDNLLVSKQNNQGLTNEEKLQFYCINQVRINTALGFSIN